MDKLRAMTESYRNSTAVIALESEQSRPGSFGLQRVIEGGRAVTVQSLDDRSVTSMDALDGILCSHWIFVSRSCKKNPAHSTLLQKHSCYFDALIRNSNSRDLQLPWEQFSFLEFGTPAMLDYIHSSGSRLDLTDDNVLDVYMTADYVLNFDMRARALAFVKARCATNIGFALAVYRCTGHYYLPELTEVALEELLIGFPSIFTEIKGWLALTPDQVHRVLRHDGLNCDSENLVLQAAALWLSSDWRQRYQYAERLMLCARLGLLKSEIVKELVGQYKFMLPNLTALWHSYPTVPDVEEVRTLFKRHEDSLAAAATPRQPHQAVLLFGGWGPDPGAPAASLAVTTSGPQAACQTYNPRANVWAMRSPGESQPPGCIGQIGRRVYAGCLIIGDIVYVLGGFDGLRALRTVSCYCLRDPGAGWYEGSCMLYRRYYVCCASVGTQMYAIGGHTGETENRVTNGRLNSVERMCISDNVWKQIASLRMVRSDAGAASIGGRVYVAGGFDGQQYHGSAEVYDPAADQWTLIRSMTYRRGGIALVALGNALYALGGNDGRERLRVIEKYQPEINQWETVGQLSQPKSNLSAAAIDDKFILAIGGWSDNGENGGVMASVEKFCTDTSTIESVADIGFAASATAAVTMRGRHLVCEYVTVPAVPSPWKFKIGGAALQRLQLQ